MATQSRNSAIYLLAVLLFGALIAGAYFFGKNQTTPSSNMHAPTQEVAQEGMIVNDPDISINPGDDMIVIENGIIEGELGYPSSSIPPLKVFALSTTDPGSFYYTQTGQNQSTFTIEDVAPGTYTVVAYTDEGLAGGWSEMVPCGLSVECDDHSLIEVEVVAGETTSDIEVRDWYAPEGTFPAMPEL